MYNFLINMCWQSKRNGSVEWYFRSGQAMPKVNLALWDEVLDKA